MHVIFPLKIWHSHTHTHTIPGITHTCKHTHTLEKRRHSDPSLMSENNHLDNGVSNWLNLNYSLTMWLCICMRVCTPVCVCVCVWASVCVCVCVFLCPHSHMWLQRVYIKDKCNRGYLTRYCYCLWSNYWQTNSTCCKIMGSTLPESDEITQSSYHLDSTW